jgi:hypothetical protein
MSLTDSDRFLFFFPSLSSTASSRKAAPCGTAVFCFAVAPE